MSTNVTSEIRPGYCDACGNGTQDIIWFRLGSLTGNMGWVSRVCIDCANDLIEQLESWQALMNKAANGERDHAQPGAAGGTLVSDISAGTSDSSGRGSY